jgi:hypothetical protein
MYFLCPDSVALMSAKTTPSVIRSATEIIIGHLYVEKNLNFTGSIILSLKGSLKLYLRDDLQADPQLLCLILQDR